MTFDKPTKFLFMAIILIPFQVFAMETRMNSFSDYLDSVKCQNGAEREYTFDQSITPPSGKFDYAVDNVIVLFDTSGSTRFSDSKDNERMAKLRPNAEIDNSKKPQKPKRRSFFNSKSSIKLEKIIPPPPRS